MRPRAVPPRLSIVMDIMVTEVAEHNIRDSRTARAMPLLGSCKREPYSDLARIASDLQSGQAARRRSAALVVLGCTMQDPLSRLLKKRMLQSTEKGQMNTYIGKAETPPASFSGQHLVLCLCGNDQLFQTTRTASIAQLVVRMNDRLLVAHGAGA